jgi:hypothetical protein
MTRRVVALTGGLHGLRGGTSGRSAVSSLTGQGTNRLLFLGPAGRVPSLRDEEVTEACTHGTPGTERIVRWFKTRIKEAASQTLAT